MSPISFEKIFHTYDVGSKERVLSIRDKFLARVFGIFSEEIVRIWGKIAQAPYKYMGRPSIIIRNGERNGERTLQLDFAFKSEDSKVYIAEMKCELELDKYRYLSLKCPRQLDHHRGKKTFDCFLDLSKNKDAYPIKVRKIIPIDGTILIWGSVVENCKDVVKGEYGFHDILSVENIATELHEARNEEYLNLLKQRCEWCQEMFSALGYK
jgi:hypothetical protein